MTEPSCEQPNPDTIPRPKSIPSGGESDAPSPFGDEIVGETHFPWLETATNKPQ